jgi:hypothetical protein
MRASTPAQQHNSKIKNESIPTGNEHTQFNEQSYKLDRVPMTISQVGLFKCPMFLEALRSLQNQNCYAKFEMILKVDHKSQHVLGNGVLSRHQ